MNAASRVALVCMAVALVALPIGAGCAVRDDRGTSAHREREGFAPYAHTIVIDEYAAAGTADAASTIATAPVMLIDSARSRACVTAWERHAMPIPVDPLSDASTARSDRAHWELRGEPLAVAEGFDEAVLSWNLDAAHGTMVIIEARVRVMQPAVSSATPGAGEWGPFLRVGYAGRLAGDGAKERRLGLGEIDSGSARIDVDVIVGKERLAALQYRLLVISDDESLSSASDPRVRVDHIAVVATRSLAERIPHRGKAVHGEQQPDAAPAFRLGVPFRSQHTSDPSLQGRLCSPASVSMVMAYYGAEGRVEALLPHSYDPLYGIHGNWPRNVQGAAEAFIAHPSPGVRLRGVVARFSEWSDVDRVLRSGTPLVVSIRAARNELRDAPYTATGGGHLIVLTGIDPNGDVYVSDPAVSTARAGQRTYRRADLERTWMGATGEVEAGSKGTAYILWTGPVRP